MSHFSKDLGFATMKPLEPRTYAPRISREESERRIIEATIELLRTNDFSEVSSRRIAERAGVHAPTIARYFGSMAGLFAAVAYELVQRSMLEVSEELHAAMFRPDMLMRSRLVAWCLANGADPALFMTTRESIGGQTLLARQAAFAPVSPRANNAFSEIVRFAFEGFAVLGPTHTFTDQDIADVIAMFQALRRSLPLIERDLGWASDSQEPTTES